MGTGLQNTVYNAEITVVDNDDTTFTVTVQLKGSNGEDLTQRAAIPFYLSSDANGDALSADGTNTADIAIATDGVLVETLTDLAGYLVSESDGDIGLTITVVDGSGGYLVLIMPDGSLVVSDAMEYSSS